MRKSYFLGGFADLGRFCHALVYSTIVVGPIASRIVLSSLLHYVSVYYHTRFVLFHISLFFPYDSLIYLHTYRHAVCNRYLTPTQHAYAYMISAVFYFSQCDASFYLSFYYVFYSTFISFFTVANACTTY